MATITVGVQDKKLKFFKELINQLSFVKIREDESTQPEGPAQRSGIPAGRMDAPSMNTPDEDTV